MLKDLRKEIGKLSNRKRAEASKWFFKTGKGEYGEGDVFNGLSVPDCRKIAKNFSNIDLGNIEKLLRSKIHEERLIALLILVDKFKKGDEKIRKEIYNFYLKNTYGINNWDLVDLSSHKIIGSYLLNKDRKILYKLAKSKNLWERRIAVVSCFAFIAEKDFKDSIKIAELLLKDKHDLVHKAVGWMLREVGKREELVLKRFLDKHYKEMPRTMLRYSLERLNKEDKKRYMGR